MGTSASKTATAIAGTHVESAAETKPPQTLTSPTVIHGAHDAANRTAVGTAAQELFGQLTAEERAFIDRCFEGLDPRQLIDVHAHIVGIGTNRSGNYINFRMNSPLTHLLCYIKKKFFLAACGVSGNEPDADLLVAEVLADLQQHTTSAPSRGHGRAWIFAFDQFHSEDGRPDPAQTGFHVPNAWVFQLAAAFPHVFVPVCSIHPYRADALEALEDAYRQGARMVKWLPNSQGMHLSHAKCQVFYRRMKELNMVLLTHTGLEHAVDMAYHNDVLGNALLLRAPLDAGVRVIAAHCASEGAECVHQREMTEVESERARSIGDQDEDEDEQMEESETDEDDPAHAAAAASSTHSRPLKRARTSSTTATPTIVGANTRQSYLSLAFGSTPVTHLQLAKPEKAKDQAQGQQRKRRRNDDDESGDDETEAHEHDHHGHSSQVQQQQQQSFDMFIRLMECKKYEGLLFGDISSITAYKRVGVLETLLNRSDLHHRLINGTDYPVPAVYTVVWTSQLRRKGYITSAQERMLNRIYKANPLLFDLLLKRCLRSSSGHRFSDCIFQTPKWLADTFQEDRLKESPARPVTTAAASRSASSSSRGRGGSDTSANDDGSGKKPIGSSGSLADDRQSSDDDDRAEVEMDDAESNHPSPPSPMPTQKKHRARTTASIAREKASSRGEDEAPPPPAAGSPQRRRTHVLPPAAARRSTRRA